MNKKRFAARDVHGILLLNKASGVGSNHVLQQAKRLFRAKKAGHTGSLDPLATGMLPICFGETTKIAGHLLGRDKAYLATAIWGAETDTDDADGQITQTTASSVPDAETVQAALPNFTGQIMQKPPIYSAIKRNGVRLYEKARNGEEVIVEARPVEIKDITLLEHSAQQSTFHIHCGTGTYIRSFVRDLGQALGCLAHVGKLHRHWVTPFAKQNMHRIEALEAVAGDLSALDAMLLPIEQALSHLPSTTLTNHQLSDLVCGRQPQLDLTPDELTLVLNDAGIAMGLLRCSQEGRAKAERMFHAAQAYTARSEMLTQQSNLKKQ